MGDPRQDDRMRRADARRGPRGRPSEGRVQRPGDGHSCPFAAHCLSDGNGSCVSGTRRMREPIPRGIGAVMADGLLESSDETCRLSASAFSYSITAAMRVCRQRRPTQLVREPLKPRMPLDDAEDKHPARVCCGGREPRDAFPLVLPHATRQRSLPALSNHFGAVAGMVE